MKEIAEGKAALDVRLSRMKKSDLLCFARITRDCLHVTLLTEACLRPPTGGSCFILLCLAPLFTLTSAMIPSPRSAAKKG